MAPACASATARLTLTVDFPTPPLPDATATMFLTPGTSCSAWRGEARRTIAPHVIWMSLAPMSVRTERAFCSISSFRGQAGVVSSIVNATRESSIAIDLTISRVTMSRPSSGSCTARSASRTAPSVIVVMRRSASFCHGKCRNTSYPACGQRPRGSCGVMPARGRRSPPRDSLSAAVRFARRRPAIRSAPASGTTQRGPGSGSVPTDAGAKLPASFGTRHVPNWRRIAVTSSFRGHLDRCMFQGNLRRGPGEP